MSFTCTVRRHTTMLRVYGSLVAERCDILQDAIAMATLMRTDGPIVVDVGGTDRLSRAAAEVLRNAADDARVRGRQFTIRSTPASRFAAAPPRQLQSRHAFAS